jgi:hypothetical protein
MPARLSRNARRHEHAAGEGPAVGEGQDDDDDAGGGANSDAALVAASP